MGKAFLAFILPMMVAAAAAANVSVWAAPGQTTPCASAVRSGLERLTIRSQHEELSSTEVWDFLQQMSRREVGLEELAQAMNRWSPDFREFWQRETGRPFRADSVTRDQLARYHTHFMERYRDPERLARLQDEALNAALAKHGVSTADSADVRKRLSVLSEINRSRLLSSFATPEEVNAASRQTGISEIVEPLQLEFEHNSHFSKITGSHLISSRQLEVYGIGGGYNTAAFNAEVVGTDDNLFFFVKWLKGDSAPAVSSAPSPYGDQAIILNPEYARKRGWISYFVMYPNELGSFGRKHLGMPEETVGILTPTGRYTPQYELPEEQLELAKNIVKKLHLLDFTVDDFESLAKSAFSVAIARKTAGMKAPEAAAYLEKLRSETPFLMEEFKAQALRPLGISEMEFKVPVAVPAGDLRVRPKFRTPTISR